MTPHPPALVKLRDEKLRNIGFDELGEDLAFENGFDSAVEILLPLLNKAITSLDIYAATNKTFPEYGDVARQTLEEIRKALDGK